MEKQFQAQNIKEDHLGCIGEFDPRDKICIKLCALNLRCAIVQEQNLRMEVLQDLLEVEAYPMRTQ
jgi:hypothetical protein